MNGLKQILLFICVSNNNNTLSDHKKIEYNVKIEQVNSQCVRFIEQNPLDFLFKECLK